MPTIINPYQNAGNSLGESLSGLGEAFFGPKASQSALYREKFREQARINENLPLYAGAMAAGGDPGEIARLGILSGQAGQDVGNYGRYVTVNRGANDLNAPPVTASILGAGGAMSSTPMGHTQSLQKGYDLDLAKTDRLVAAQQFKDARERVNVRDPLNPLGYKTITVGEFAANPGAYQEVTSQDILKSSIAGSPSGYISGFPGQTPSQGAYLGSAPTADKEMNWIAPPATPGGQPLRGRTIQGSNIDIDTQQRLPPGAVIQSPLAASGAAGLSLPTAPGTGLTKDIQSAIRNADQTISLTGQIKQLVNADPTLVGGVGIVRRAGQEVVDVGRSVNMLFGGPERAQQTLDNARTSLAARTPGGLEAARKLLPSLFDSNLTRIQTLNGLLVYQAAAAIGQDGRNASDADIKRVLAIVGSPDQWLQGPQTYLSKVDQLEQIISQQRDSDVKILRGGDVTAGGRTAPPPGVTAAPAVDSLIQKYLTLPAGP